MVGVIGGFLVSYVFPLAGLALLLLGAWSAWQAWSPGAWPDKTRPTVSVRVSTLILGEMAGWLLNVIALPRDAQHIILGFPMPVMTLVRDGGLAPGTSASPSCALLNLVIGIGLAHAALCALWPRLVHRSQRARRKLRVDRPVHHPLQGRGSGKRPVQVHARAALRPLPPAAERPAGRGREDLRQALRGELADSEQTRPGTDA
jgi:hypothetical protein